MTMEKHHRDQAKAAEVEEARQRAEQEALDKEHGLIPVQKRRRRRHRSRRSSSSSSSSSSDSDGGRSRRSQRHGSSSDDGVENLPDRFDKDGRRLDKRSVAANRWTSRSGDFQYIPQRRGDWDVRGAWTVGGTDGEMIERLARDVAGVLDGKKGWIGVLGDVLGGFAGQTARGSIKDRDGSKNDDSDDDNDRRHGKQRRRRR